LAFSIFVNLACLQLIRRGKRNLNPKSTGMNHNAKSIRPFIGAQDYERSRSFYRDLGFEETVLSAGMSLFSSGAFGFYLQDAYVKDWIDNTMVFMEVEQVDRFWAELQALDLPSKYAEVRVVPVKTLPWGKECFVHDPSGILWHFGEFNG
jgi:catechol 2,3-dioxygenase-like lactoylglutathione lyase family enzyme